MGATEQMSMMMNMMGMQQQPQVDLSDYLDKNEVAMLVESEIRNLKLETETKLQEESKYLLDKIYEQGDRIVEIRKDCDKALDLVKEAKFDLEVKTENMNLEMKNILKMNSREKADM